MTVIESLTKPEDHGTIGPYRITRLLGEGAFGRVYEAYQPFLDRKVAIKVLRTDVKTDPHAEQRFMREARTIARLRHPKTVAVYEFGSIVDNGNPLTYMVMEYLPGDTLSARMQPGPMALAEVVAILEQLAEGLDYAHSQGIVHRDLKPANIIFSEYNEPVIVDFGLAHLVELSQSSVTDNSENEPHVTWFGGTPNYMAPEQITLGTFSAATDQYALAIIVYEMLTGKRPFIAQDTAEQLKAHLEQVPVPIRSFAPSLPQAVEPILQRALARDAADRYPSVGEFAAHLADALLPDRRRTTRTFISDPIQAAALKATRQSLTVALWGTVLVTVIGLLFCISVFLRGYAEGQSPFLWDGIVEPNNRLENGQRIVSGLWPGSPAERSGLQIGDQIPDDLTKDRTLQSAHFLINTRPRSEYPIDWLPQVNDLIQYTAIRDGQQINIAYRLERSPYQLILLALNLLPIAFTLGGAVWLLARWGPEPGVQLMAPVLLAASGTIMGVVVLRLIPGINILTMYILLPTLIYGILIFPERSRFLDRYARFGRLLFLPFILGLVQFLLQSFVRIGNTDANVIAFALLGVLTLMIAYVKWIKHDIKYYPSLWGIIFAVGILVFATVVSTVIWGQDHAHILAYFGTGVTQVLAGYLVIALGAMIGTLATLIGFNRVQAKLGPSVVERKEVAHAVAQDNEATLFLPI